MNELKPCPFCGESVYLDKIPLWSSHNGITHGYGGCYEFDVHCRNPKCGCSIKLFKNNTIYSSEEEARLNAIKAWNRRCMNGEQMMKCCGNCEYRRQSKLKIQFNEISITAYCDNKNSSYYNKYIWDTDCCAEWKGVDDNESD